MWRGIIDLAQPPDTPAGAAIAAWELRCLSEGVANVFGYHALQLGMPVLPALSANRMPHRWLATRQASPAACPDVVTDFHALPFPDASLDLVVLPHTLESDPNPHGVLREVTRVLVPGGRVLIAGLNPTSLWPWQLRHHGGVQHKIGYWRLRDWLRLLDFEVMQAEFGGFAPPVTNARWLARWQWAEHLGPRTTPMLGAAYVVSAIKQVRGLRLMAQPWRQRAPSAVQPSAAAREGAQALHSGLPERD